VGCITERLDLTLAARATGFLATPAQFRTALRNIDGMATMWRRHPGVPAAHVEELESLSRAIATLLPA
jgi:hypothetical protein